ncbi:hypothetical protein IP88_06545 [alpha proteobacterium AAP81b]|nr:hypothetical protein IP88_06545 [alpha proteobacterium AAP81b]
MATVHLILPDDLAESATRLGLFQPAASEAMVRDAIRRQAGAELRAIRERLQADPLPPMSEAEIQEEIDAVRAEKRRAAGR